MQELRLVGVHEDGEHLLLSDRAGEEFSLPITEALRAAATRPIGRPSAHAADLAAGTLSPKDIQARIRAGATADQVSAEFGLDLERVRRYEGPVLAERYWMVEQAQKVEVQGVSGSESVRSGEDGPVTLEGLVRQRLQVLGIDLDTLRWDAWREEDGTWCVVADFSTDGASSSVGELPPALWTYRPAGRAVENRNRWAQVLSDQDALDGPFGARRLSAVGDRPFDVEQVEAPSVSSAHPSARSSHPSRMPLDADSQDELLEVLRARRGQRLGVDEEGDDELALMLTRDEQPVETSGERPRLQVASWNQEHDGDDETADGAAEDADSEGDGHDSEDTTVQVDGADAGEDDSQDRTARRLSPLRLIRDRQEPRKSSQDGEDDTESEAGAEGDDATLLLEFDASGQPSVPDEEEDEDWIAERSRAADRRTADTAADASSKEKTSEADSEDSDRKDTERKPAAKPAASGRRGGRQKRPSVPSWDEIVFGRKND